MAHPGQSSCEQDKSRCLCFLLTIFKCVSLLLWLEELYQTVDMRHPGGFQQGSRTLVALDNPLPTLRDLPENIFGDGWAFVQLPSSAVRGGDNSLFETRYASGGSLDLDLLGVEIDNNTSIPGLAVASSPLAAWMNFVLLVYLCYVPTRRMHRRQAE